LGYRLEVAVPLPKGDRGHFLLEKLTEIGVTHFVPLETERSVIHPGANRLEKLRRYVIEASKQSGRNILLQVKPVQPWKSYCLDFNLPPARILAHPGGQAGIITPGKDMAVALGPEGGFTDQEIAQASSSGWRVVGFGPRILRIETAAIVAAALGAGL